MYQVRYFPKRWRTMDPVTKRATGFYRFWVVSWNRLWYFPLNRLRFHLADYLVGTPRPGELLYYMRWPDGAGGFGVIPYGDWKDKEPAVVEHLKFFRRDNQLP